MDRVEHHAPLCPAARVGSVQAEVQRRRLSWCCARKAATHHPPSVPSHGLNNTSFFKGMMLANRVDAKRYRSRNKEMQIVPLKIYLAGKRVKQATYWWSMPIARKNSHGHAVVDCGRVLHKTKRRSALVGRELSQTNRQHTFLWERERELAHVLAVW